MEEKNTSRLSDHKIRKGMVVTPFNYAFGDLLKLDSWGENRLPEYLWLALILSYYGRDEGLKIGGQILQEMAEAFPELDQPKCSLIFKLTNESQKALYRIITKHVKHTALTPLSVLYRYKDHPIFNDFFYDQKYLVEKKVEILEKAINDYFPAHSYGATDVAFLVVWFQIFRGSISFPEGDVSTKDALLKYHSCSHEDEAMKMYRPLIRSTEGGTNFMRETDADFIEAFWKELGSITTCKLMYINYKGDESVPEEYLGDTREAIKYVILRNKERTLSNPKLEVIIGSSTYALKLFQEVVDCNLNNKILGRHAIRTMLEILIILKYLLKKETEKAGIWKEYQYYGISKYKLVLLKAREDPPTADNHLSIQLIDLLVNEKVWEEFIDVDLRYFDQGHIREKSIDVDEKRLYDLYYDYDSNYVHGLWGAVRESSMLICDNAAHKYHDIPDVESNQNLPGVQADCLMVMKKIMLLVSKLYELPERYFKRYYGDEDIETSR